MRRDPERATLAGELSARHKDCEPLADKSTLNRLEHAPDIKDGSRYHEIVLDLDATDDPLHGQQEGASSAAPTAVM